MKLTTENLLKFLTVLSWILFLGLSVEAGGFIFNIIYTMMVHETEAKFFWEKVDFSSLLEYSQKHFLIVTILMSLVGILKAWMFYIIVEYLQFKKISLTRPFSNETYEFCLLLSYFAFSIGIMALGTAKYVDHLSEMGVTMPALQHMKLAGGDVSIFMAIILFVFSQLFRRGIEIQNENDLTV